MSSCPLQLREEPQIGVTTKDDAFKFIILKIDKKARKEGKREAAGKDEGEGTRERRHAQKCTKSSTEKAVGN